MIGPSNPHAVAARAALAALLAERPKPERDEGIVRRVRLKLFVPGNHGFTRKTVAAGARRQFTEEGIEQVLAWAVSEVERLFPGHEYDLVEVGPGEFNFVWQREKEKPTEFESFSAVPSLREISAP